MARYDGIRYGKSASAENKSLLIFILIRGENIWVFSAAENNAGKLCLSEGHFDDYYQKARNVLLIRKIFKCF